MKLCSDNLLHRQSRKLSGNDEGCGTRGLEQGLGRRDEGFKRKGHGFENLAATKSFFLLLSLPINKRTKPLFFYLPLVSFKTLEGTKKYLLYSQTASKRNFKTFNAKLMSTINCQIHGIQNPIKTIKLRMPLTI